MSISFGSWLWLCSYLGFPLPHRTRLQMKVVVNQKTKQSRTQGHWGSGFSYLTFVTRLQVLHCSYFSNPTFSCVNKRTNRLLLNVEVDANKGERFLCNSTRRYLKPLAPFLSSTTSCLSLSACVPCVCNDVFIFLEPFPSILSQYLFSFFCTHFVHVLLYRLERVERLHELQCGVRWRCTATLSTLFTVGAGRPCGAKRTDRRDRSTDGNAFIFQHTQQCF